MSAKECCRLGGVEPATSWSPVGRASNWATEAGNLLEYRVLRNMDYPEWKWNLFLSRWQCLKRRQLITKTCLFEYIENCTTENWKLSDNNFDIFHISAQNTDCRYSLEPRTHNLCFWAEIRKINVFPCKHQFYYIKVGFKGVKIL